MIKVFGSKTGKEEISILEDTINSQWLGMGNKVNDFENKFKKRLDLKHFMMIDCASNGLYMACKLLDLPKNSEVIIPSFTWVGCAHAVLLAGYKPVFCDVDLQTQNISAELIVPHITNRTKAIMIVHYAGLPVHMAPILEFGLPIIEDAAHAVDSKIKNTYCGNIGDIGVYSFDSMKNIAVGEGGGISIKDGKRFERAQKLRLCGVGKSSLENAKIKKRWWVEEISECFIKMLPSDISASIALGQLSKIESLQASRKNIWKTYQNEFKDIGEIITPVDANNSDRHSYFTYSIRVGSYRDKLALYLYDKGIYTTLRFAPLHLQPFFRNKSRKAILPNSETLNEEALNIPLHPDLAESELSFVIDSIKKFFS